MKTVYLFLAEGFEEIEAITPIDILRRAGVEVKTVGVGGKTIKGSHDILVEADLFGDGFRLPADADMVLLPGGGLGTENLQKCTMIAQVLADASERGIYIGAICAAPTVLHKAGLLQGKTVTAFPSVQNQLTGSNVTGGAVEVDGTIITARSAGVALSYAKTLAALLVGEEKAEDVVANIYP